MKKKGNTESKSHLSEGGDFEASERRALANEEGGNNDRGVW
jgi:hypothetical protein